MKQFACVLVFISLFGAFGCQPSEERSTPKSAISTVKTVEPALRSGAAIEVMEKEIELGDIGVEEDEIVGRIVFFNVGSETLWINKIDGPCACLAGYSGDKTVEPGEGGELAVKFDKSRIPSGKIRRLVNIRTNDAENKVAKVYFEFNVKRSRAEEDIRIVRLEVINIHKDIKALRKDVRDLVDELKKIKTVQAKPQKRPQADTTVYDVAIGDSPVSGPKDAPVTIVEFTDFQCPYGVREYPKIKQILGEYPDKVKFVFKHFPLGFHKKARPAHAAAELARLEAGGDAFWKMHDMIMAEPKKLEVSVLRGYAESLGLDLAKFDEVMGDEKKIDALLSADMAEAKKCKVRGTPTVFINGVKMANREIGTYKKRIGQILSGLEKPKG